MYYCGQTADLISKVKNEGRGVWQLLNPQQLSAVLLDFTRQLPRNVQRGWGQTQLYKCSYLEF